MIKIIYINNKKANTSSMGIERCLIEMKNEEEQTIAKFFDSSPGFF